MEPNRIKEILKKIEAGEPDPLMPVINKPLPVEDPKPEVKSASKPSEIEGVPKWKLTLLALISFLILAGASYGGYLVYKNYKVISGDAPENVITALGRLTDLPTGEVPTVSTVTEIESLKNQPFFKDAQIGDKVVVFNNAKRAYIYRPSTQKLIGIAPLSQ